MIWAVGGGLAVYLMSSYADQTEHQLAPEVVAYMYYPFASHFLLRAGARFNYAWDQIKDTQALHISQTDFRYFAEVGLAYNWIIIPDVSIGVGADYRVVQLKTKPPIFVLKDNISYARNLAAMYVQGGVGFPLIQGLMVLEPYVRYTIVQNPGENTFGYGIEITFQI